MNENGTRRAALLERRDYTNAEYRSRLTRMRILQTLLHCSAEIDESALRYFSVNGVHLHAEAYRLVLFSESGVPDRSGSIYSRMGLYAVVEEAIEEEYGGLCSFYTVETDGRLALLLLDPDSMAESGREPDDACRAVAARCEKEFGISLAAYISETIPALRRISPLYTKLSEHATLHHYTARTFDDPVIHGRLPKINQAATRLPSIQGSAQRLAGALVSGGDYLSEVNRVLAHFARERANSVDDLLRLFGDYFELTCQKLVQFGVQVDTDRLRREQFALFEASTLWAEIVSWFCSSLDAIRAEREQAMEARSARQFSMALAYLEAHLSDPALTTAACAAAAGCSIVALGRLFQNRFKLSVSRYLRKMRLSIAMEQLLAGQQVKDIWISTGFGSLETFHRAFKAEYGVTPGQIKKGDRSVRSF